MITNEVLVAAAKGLEKMVEAVPVGTHLVDEVVTIHVRGTVTKSKDTEYTPTAEIPLKAALALLLEKSGVTGPRAMDLLVEALVEATDKSKVEAIGERMKNIDVAMAAVQKTLGELPKKTRAGATRVAVEVEVVEPGLALAAA